MGHKLHVTGSLEDVSRAGLRHACDALLLQTDGLDRRTISGFSAAWHSENGMPVIALARERTIPDAVRTIRAGASDYLPVYPMNAERFRDALEQALTERLGPPATPVPDDTPLAEGFFSADDHVRQIWSLLARVADAKSPLLLTGESGTGKTVLARAVHNVSCRRDGPLVDVNCGSLSEPLLESELFGHVRGAFTTAYYSRAGKFEAADGGTMLLDEIAGASPRLQMRLLRVLDSGEFERVGETLVRRVDVRLIVSTNMPLQQQVGEGHFREDLYHRLAVIQMELPPLRERVCDIPLLARHFLKEYAERHHREVEDVSADALDRLVHYWWPGNVRELRNVMEYGVIMTRGARLEAEALPRRIQEYETRDASGYGAALLPLKEALREPERRCILRALENAAGNKLQAAEDLGISRSTLYKKMKELGLDPDGHFGEVAAGESREIAHRGT
jgi:DNA-binding NtrC family response regulator